MPCERLHLHTERQCYAESIDKSYFSKISRVSRKIFVDYNKKLKHCPNRNCSKVVSYKKLCPNRKSNATAACLGVGAAKAPHAPLACGLMERFKSEGNTTSEENGKLWMEANTKYCPRKKKIYKDGGCMHMSCKCGYEFCWLCLKSWRRHGSSTGFYACNYYERAKAEGKLKGEAADYANAHDEAAKQKEEQERLAWHRERFDFMANSVSFMVENVHPKMRHVAETFALVIKSKELKTQFCQHMIFSFDAESC